MLAIITSMNICSFCPPLFFWSLSSSSPSFPPPLHLDFSFVIFITFCFLPVSLLLSLSLLSFSCLSIFLFFLSFFFLHLISSIPSLYQFLLIKLIYKNGYSNKYVDNHWHQALTRLPKPKISKYVHKEIIIILKKVKGMYYCKQ